MLITDLDYRIKNKDCKIIQLGVTVKDLGSFVVNIEQEDDDSFTEFVLNIEQNCKANIDKFVLLSGKPVTDPNDKIYELCIRAKDIIFIEKLL